jgi:rhomboid protease GluP
MLSEMFKRQKTGSVVCSSCGSLVGVNDERCYNCGRRNPGLWGFGPTLRRFGNDLGFVTLVIYGCSILYALMLIVTVALGGDVFGGGNVMTLLSPAPGVSRIFGAAGSGPVFVLGMWWTVLSASWLHGSALHILFNMLWVRDLGPATSEIYGPARMVIIYTVAGVVGFFLSSVGQLLLGQLNGTTLGASASIFGLLGALVYYGRRGGSSMAGSMALQYAVILFVSGFLLPGVDNVAHAGGFVGGYAAAIWLDPLKPERTDHLVMAVGCLIVSAIAVLASFFKWLPILIRFIREM